jgi:hypothetical protein
MPPYLFCNFNFLLSFALKQTRCQQRPPQRKARSSTLKMRAHWEGKGEQGEDPASKYADSATNC